MKFNSFGKTLFASICLLGVTSTLTACGGLGDKGSNGSSDDKTFTIGLATAMTGDFAEIGKNSKRGAEMALAEVNDAGGFAGAKGKLVVEDSAGKPSTGVNAVARLTQEVGAEALLGPDLSTVTLAALDVSKAAEIPQITSSISPALINEETSDWLFRARPSDATNAEIMVRYAVEDLGLKRIALLYGLDAYGEGSLPVLKKAAQDLGANIVLIKGVTSGTKNVTSQVTAAKRNNADGILWWGLIPESAVLEKAVDSLGFEGALLGANALVNGSTLELAGSSANGAIAATTFVPNDPDEQVQEFVKKYQNEYGELPNDHAPLYYDMVMALAEAANQAGSTDPAAVRDAFKSVTYDGVTGTMKWNDIGEYDSQSAVIVQVSDGKTEVLGRMS